LLLALYSLPIENPSSLEPATGLSELFPLSLSLSLSLPFERSKREIFFIKQTTTTTTTARKLPLQPNAGTTTAVEDWSDDPGEGKKSRLHESCSARTHARTVARAPTNGVAGRGRRDRKHKRMAPSMTSTVRLSPSRLPSCTVHGDNDHCQVPDSQERIGWKIIIQISRIGRKRVNKRMKTLVSSKMETSEINHPQPSSRFPINNREVWDVGRWLGD
jgi:hypothetical protein